MFTGPNIRVSSVSKLFLLVVILDADRVFNGESASVGVLHAAIHHSNLVLCAKLMTA